MSEQPSGKPLVGRILEQAGYTSDSEVRERLEKAAGDGAARERDRIFLDLLSQPVYPLEFVVPAWEAYQKYGKQTGEMGILAKLAWKPMSDLIGLLHKMDIDLVGFSQKDGPVTLPYDPNQQKTPHRQIQDNDGVTTIIDNPPWGVGDLVKVVVPGVIDKRSGVYLRYPVVDQVVVT